MTSRPLALLCAFVAFATAFGSSREAGACLCFEDMDVLWPLEGATDVPANVRVIGIVPPGGTANVTAYYDGDPADEAAGTVELQPGWGPFDVWLFTPVAPWTAGRSVTAALDTGAGSAPLLRTFVAGAATDGAPPVFAGATSMAAFENTVWAASGQEDCRDTFTPGEVHDGLTMGWTDATDDSTSAAVLLYRIHLSGTPGDVPSTPFGVAPRARLNPTTACLPEDCERPLAYPLVPGDGLCVRIEVEDAAGNRAGLDAEACGTVAAADVEYVAGECSPVAPPAGDAGTGDGGDAGLVEMCQCIGCRCRIIGAAPGAYGAGGAGGAGGIIGPVALLVLAAVLRRRRRQRRGHPGTIPALNAPPPLLSTDRRRRRLHNSG